VLDQSVSRKHECSAIFNIAYQIRRTLLRGVTFVNRQVVGFPVDGHADVAVIGYRSCVVGVTIEFLVVACATRCLTRVEQYVVVAVYAAVDIDGKISVIHNV
jgi:hypothetical protein